MLKNKNVSDIKFLLDVSLSDFCKRGLVAPFKIIIATFYKCK